MYTNINQNTTEVVDTYKINKRLNLNNILYY